MKLAYFAELKENFFFPVSLSEISQSLKMDPHSLVFTLIILGGVPLALISYYVLNIRNLQKPPFLLNINTQMFFTVD